MKKDRQAIGDSDGHPFLPRRLRIFVKEGLESVCLLWRYAASLRGYRFFIERRRSWRLRFNGKWKLKRGLFFGHDDLECVPATATQAHDRESILGGWPIIKYCGPSFYR
jgi:hypothetical protein